MSMPIFKHIVGFTVLLTLAACSGGDGSGAFEEADRQADEAGKIECALAGAASFARVCTTERIAGTGGPLLIIRHPDGGFRRFNILTDGRGLAAAQGADPTSISILNDGQIELKSADDKYRLPAKIKTNATGSAPANITPPKEKITPGADAG